MKYTTIKEKSGYKLLKRNDGKYCVVQVRGNQVYSTMPGDMPLNGGQWYSNNCFTGIDYVANGYSESYARKMFNLFTKEDEL